MQIIISRSARADLEAIARYSEREWGAARAKSYLATFSERFALLIRRPRLGAPRDDVSAGYRD
jgi:plasmid stabilization system protein ParE